MITQALYCTIAMAERVFRNRAVQLLFIAVLINVLLTTRAAAGLTQADLAQAIGVSRKTINTIENEVFVPSTALALRLAQVLGKNVETLFALAPDDDVAKE